MIWLQRFAENNKNSKRKIVAKMDKPGKINLSPMGMRLFGQPPSHPPLRERIRRLEALAHQDG